MLKRDLAPLSESAWNEIDKRAEAILKTSLSARKAVKVIGPKGWDHTAISEGRLDITDAQEGEVKTGVYKVQPLIEGRMSFSLDRWEMDNITRGAKDIDLTALDIAVKKIVTFEENALFNGLDAANITGLINGSDNEPIPFGQDGATIMDAVTKGLIILKENFEDSPYTLLVGKEAWTRLNKEVQGYPLINRIENLTGGKVLFSSVIEGAILIPFDNDNLELTIGQDFAIGYEYHDSKEVSLFITESFTFRVLDGSIIVPYIM
ncbi:bacteriocin [Alkalibaculum sp. M08DMB]|uniref:Type 1 encapsulin shell protein n=2 Tax=Alkalibaculum sporogenes TaxID=2655001 RepID=A0A6A7K9E6_9FIRM|nr:bacteriocin [Alkalibaculum sporogenes]